MAKDFSSDQPAPASRTSTEFGVQEGGTPQSGISEAPRVGLPDTGPGEGIPPSNKKIR